MMVLLVLAQGVFLSHRGNASIPAGGALPASAIPAAPFPRTNDLDLADLCRTDMAGIPGLGSAPTSIPCPGMVAADPSADPCLLPDLSDPCVGQDPLGMGFGPEEPGAAAEAEEDEAEAATQDAPSAGMGEWTMVGSPNPSSAPNILSGVSCVTPSDCWAVGRSGSGLGRSLTMRWEGNSWEVVPSPKIDTARAHILSDVACVSPADCWAVGSYITAAFRVRTLIQRWDGVSWEILTSPDIGAAPWNGLESVTCISTSDCWAVGFDTSGTSAKTLILRWDGSSWEVHSSPNAGTQHNVLYGATCVSTSDCWAVGSFSTDTGAKQTLSLRWDGSSWEVSDSADALGAEENVLSGVTCVSTSDCWAVGHSYNGVARQTLIERWDGTSWTTVVSPNALGPLDSYLSRVTCASANDCWAVGHSNDSITIDQRFIVRWDGTAWAPATLPDPLATRESVLGGIACPSSSDCWAAGSLGAGGTARSLVIRWDGTSWSSAATPTVGTTEESNGFLRGVTCVSASDCWAVGFYFSGNVARSLTMHWDGTSWEIVASPNTVLGRNNYLKSVTCISISDCWAVGRHTDTIGTAGQTLTLHWDGTSWSIVASSPADTSAAQSNAFESVSCLSASDCWAVGHSKIDSRYYAHIKHWNGISWVPVAAPHKGLPTQSDILYGVSCVSTSECSAVGAQWTGTVYQTLIERWDGTSWAVVDSPNLVDERNNILSGVNCVAASDCWAVGQADAAANDQILILHWDGSSWDAVSAPRKKDFLTNVTCLSSSDCWAVGPYYGTPGSSPPQTLAVHWDGAAWSVAGSPNTSPSQLNILTSVACTSSSGCWAVGEHRPTGDSAQTLVLRYATGEVQPETTEVAFTENSATAGQYSDQILLEARLTDSQGDPIEGEMLTFALTGEGLTREFTGTANQSGIASVIPTLQEKPGPYQLEVRYLGADGRAASDSTTGFVVTREDSDTELTVEGRGKDTSLRARLSDLDLPSAGISGRTINFYSDGELIGTAETDAHGVASVPVPPMHRGINRTYEGAFVGDDFFLSSSDTRPGQAGGANESEIAQPPAGASQGKNFIL